MIFKLALLVTLGLSVDVWTSFVNEEGLEYDATTGVELASQFATSRGGNGGGAWTDDCDGKGGLKQITMECGRYAGSFQLRCKNNALCPKRGAGLGNGHGGTSTFDASGITKVLVRAGRYVDKVVFYRGNSAVKSCGSSNGGGAYYASAPAGMELCGLKGRSGWWTDKLAAGWCKKPEQPCPQHCMAKPLSIANGGTKTDFQSHRNGDQIRKWFNGPALKGTGDKVSGSVEYRDQGWGNRKTDVFLCCNCGATTQSGSNCVPLCGTSLGHSRSFKKCDFNKALAGTCKKGSSTCVAYRVGGGGGHRFYGRKFNGKISHKDIADVLNIQFDGLFVSSVEIAESQEESGYVSHAAIGLGGIIFGLGAAVVMRRRQQVDYQSLV